MPNNAESPSRLNQLPASIVYNTPDSQFLQSKFLSEIPVSNLVQFSECTDKSVSTTSQTCISEKSNVGFTKKETPGAIACIAPCLSVRDDECGSLESTVDRIASPTDSREYLHEVHESNVQDKSGVHPTIQSLSNKQPMEIGEENPSSSSTENTTPVPGPERLEEPQVSISRTGLAGPSSVVGIAEEPVSVQSEGSLGLEPFCSPIRTGSPSTSSNPIGDNKDSTPVSGFTSDACNDGDRVGETYEPMEVTLTILYYIILFNLVHGTSIASDTDSLV